MMRKSIIFDKKTPNVFYCPQSKPKGTLGKIIFFLIVIWNYNNFILLKGIDKLYVHARPLSKLCEFDGKPPPKSHKPDCYQDVDETEYACKEKQRIMVTNKINFTWGND